MTRIYHGARPAPSHLFFDDYTDHEIGPLKRGKEAEVWVIERRAPDGRRCLLADKRYIPPEERAFKNDATYRAHRRLDGIVRDVGGRRRRSGGAGRVQRAMDAGSSFGMQVRHGQWVQAEFSALRALWEIGAPVPYPLDRTDEGVLMEFIGDDDGAAPRLAQYRGDALDPLARQAAEAIRAMATAGIVHADLSPYNVLVHDGRLVVIDVPQAVPALENMEATELLHRDCHNLMGWFRKKGVDVDPEDVFVAALSVLFDRQMEDMFHAHGG